MRRKRKRSDDETQEYSENKEEIVPCSESKDRDGSEEEEKARMRHEKVDEDSIPSLEARVKALRVEASQLTSADTFVQYARVTREANRLEKRLTELKGNDETLDGMINIDHVMDVVSKSVLGRKPNSFHDRLSRRLIAKAAVRVILVGVLWYWFSYGRVGPTRGQVMTINCNIVRPFAWLLRRQDLKCGSDDWLCAARQGQTCGVSFILAAAICNAAVSIVVDCLFKPIFVQ